MKKINNYRGLLTALFCALLLSACVTAPKMASPDQLASVAPKPIEGNSGKFMSPYTSDGVVAEWVDKAINAKMGAAIGSAVGAKVGQDLAENIPFVGGFLGQKIGNAAGRQIAIKASGGMEFITSTSDLSFNSIQDLSVFMYVNYGASEHYADVLSATQEIYPEMKTIYYQSLMNASKNVQK